MKNSKNINSEIYGERFGLFESFVVVLSTVTVCVGVLTAIGFIAALILKLVL